MHFIKPGLCILSKRENITCIDDENVHRIVYITVSPNIK